MNGILDEIKYFTAIAEKAPPLEWGSFRPFKITFKMRSPVCVTTPWINFDSLLGHLIMMDTFGQDYFVLPRKLNITPYLDQANARRLVPLKKIGDIYHCSVSIFYPNSIRVTQMYKRFEERWSENLAQKKIRIGAGHFRAYAMKTVYIPAKEVIYYANGDIDLTKRLIEEYMLGLGNDIRVGWGALKDVLFEEIEEDWSLVANGVAMRPIPIEMCAEYDDAAYLAYKGPYWDPKNTTLCVPPGARCKLKDEYGGSANTVGQNGRTQS